MKTTFINSTVAEYTAAEFSWLQAKVMSSGYIANQDGTRTFAVTQKSTPSLGIDITAGSLIMPFSKGGVDWKLIVETTGESLSIAPNSSGATRIDAVIVQSSNTVDPNALKSNVSSAAVIQGTGAVALTDLEIQTAIGSDYAFIRLANVTVVNGATQIFTADIASTIEKTRITAAIDVSADSVIIDTDTAASSFEYVTTPIDLKNGDVVDIIRSVEYGYQTPTNITAADNGLEELGVLTGETLGADLQNNRGGIYEFGGKHWIFYMSNSIIKWRTKTAGLNGNTGNWSAAQSSPIASITGNLNKSWTMGMGKDNVFRFAYIDSSGDIKHRIGTPNTSGNITFSSEVTAWTDAIFNANTAAGIDSEVVDGKYFVTFQGNDGTNRKPILICNTKNDGTWSNLASTPFDLSVASTNAYHGYGTAMTGIGDKLIAFKWGDFIMGYDAYREFDIENISFSTAVSTRTGGTTATIYTVPQQSRLTLYNGAVYSNGLPSGSVPGAFAATKNVRAMPSSIPSVTITGYNKFNPFNTTNALISATNNSLYQFGDLNDSNISSWESVSGSGTMNNTPSPFYVIHSANIFNTGILNARQDENGSQRFAGFITRHIATNRLVAKYVGTISVEKTLVKSRPLYQFSKRGIVNEDTLAGNVVKVITSDIVTITSTTLKKGNYYGVRHDSKLHIVPTEKNAIGYAITESDLLIIRKDGGQRRYVENLNFTDTSIFTPNEECFITYQSDLGATGMSPTLYRFRGYDANGNYIYTGNTSDSINSSVDGSAVTQKMYPGDVLATSSSSPLILNVYNT